VLGKWVNYTNAIFSTSSLDFIDLVANFGLQLYIFTVGLEIDLQYMISNAHSAGVIAISSMAVPFVFGLAISLLMFESLQTSAQSSANSIEFFSFSFFIGTAMSITAFPVLARIIKESDLLCTTVGSLTMGAASINDAISWVLLIITISISNVAHIVSIIILLQINELLLLVKGKHQQLVQLHSDLNIC
jgi:Kef-type K+ transport system membrane component KefB